MQLSVEKKEWVYNFLNNTLNFMPDSSTPSAFLPFSIGRPFAVYDIANLTDEQFELLYELAPVAIQKCLKSGNKIYSIDWNHNTILYDPLNPKNAECTHPASPSFTKSGLAYFNGFYPDGDYYFFIDRYGSFGYLSHPWREEIWVFGADLVEEFEKINIQLKFRQKAILK